MSTMLETWGFSDVLAVEADISEFCKALNEAAQSRGISPERPSDALDMSRNICIDEAAQAVGAHWSIEDHTVRLWRADLRVDWNTLIEEIE